MLLTSLLLILFALLGAPLFAVIAASAMLGFARAEIDLSIVAIEFFGLAEMPILIAIPLFTFGIFSVNRGIDPRSQFGQSGQNDRNEVRFSIRRRLPRLAIQVKARKDSNRKATTQHHR